MKPDLFWVPGPWLDDEAAAWHHAGLDVIVSLLENEEAGQLDLLDESEAAENHALRFVSFPIPDRGVPASLQEAASLISGITAQLEAGKNVAVHCRQGIGRSGLIAAGILIASGTNPEQAIQIVTSARGLPVPETAEQRRWMERLPSRLAVTKS